MSSPLRSRVRRAVLGKTDAKIARQQRRLETQAKQLSDLEATQDGRHSTLVNRADKAAATAAALKKSVEALSQQVRQLAARVETLERTTGQLSGRATKADADLRARDVEFELRRAQVGALEARLGRLEESPPAGVDDDGDNASQALDLLTEVRREHERIRLRMQVISLYEERLRRVEETLLALYPGDERHRL